MPKVYIQNTNKSKKLFSFTLKFMSLQESPVQCGWEAEGTAWSQYLIDVSR